MPKYCLVLVLICCVACASVWAKPAHNGEDDEISSVSVEGISPSSDPVDMRRNEADDDDDDDSPLNSMEVLWQQFLTIIQGLSDEVPREAFDLPDEYKNTTSVTQVVNGTKVTVNQTLHKELNDGVQTFYHIKVVSISALDDDDDGDEKYLKPSFETAVSDDN